MSDVKRYFFVPLGADYVLASDYDALRVELGRTRVDVEDKHAELQAKCAELAEARLDVEIARNNSVVERNALRAEVERLRGALERAVPVIEEYAQMHPKCGGKLIDEVLSIARDALAADQPTAGLIAQAFTQCSLQNTPRCLDWPRCPCGDLPLNRLSSKTAEGK